jgi:superfamily II DNA/RNA helicase
MVHGAITDDIKEFCKLVNKKFRVTVRNWQAACMQAVLEGRDVIVRAGTGLGKSLIFQALFLSQIALHKLRLKIVVRHLDPWPTSRMSTMTKLLSFVP